MNDESLETTDLALANRRAWMAGTGIGVIGGVIAAGTGLLAGFCCLLQFGNILVPALAGVVGGGAAAGLANFASFAPDRAVGIGAGLGLRGGGTAAAVSGIVGFLLSLAGPVLSACVVALSALGAGGLGEAITVLFTALLSFATSAIFAAVFAVVGTLVGLALGAGTGAAVGAVRAPKV